MLHNYYNTYDCISNCLVCIEIRQYILNIMFSCTLTQTELNPHTALVYFGETNVVLIEKDDQRQYVIISLPSLAQFSLHHQ